MVAIKNFRKYKLGKKKITQLYYMKIVTAMGCSFTTTHTLSYGICSITFFT